MSFLFLIVTSPACHKHGLPALLTDQTYIRLCPTMAENLKTREHMCNLKQNKTNKPHPKTTTTVAT